MTIKIEPGMYITIETLEKLGPIRYQLFRDVLRGRGYKVSDAYGRYKFVNHAVGDAIRLHPDGDLVWTDVDIMVKSSYELTFDQVMIIIDCCLPPSIKSNPSIEELAQHIQQLTDQRDRLNTELNHYKQLLIKKLA